MALSVDLVQLNRFSHKCDEAAGLAFVFAVAPFADILPEAEPCVDSDANELGSCNVASYVTIGKSVEHAGDDEELKQAISNAYAVLVNRFPIASTEPDLIVTEDDRTEAPKPLI